MSGLPTNGGYNYYFDRQYYDLEKGYTVLNTIFNAKITLPAGFSYQFNIAPRYQWFYDRYWMSADLPNASAADRGVNRGWSKNFDWNLNNTITWDKIFGEHHFTATLVQEAEEHRYWSDNVNARNITPSDALGFHYTQGANKTQSGFSTNDTHYTAASYLGRLFYSFKDRYMFTGTFRRDGYSGFGSNNPWGNFGSVGLSWVFSEENFMSDAHDWMDMGKLRLSWGTNGNREFGDVYSTLSNLSLAGGSMVYYQNGNSNVVNPLYMSRLAAPNLEWEKTKAWNIGLDFSFLNGRLTANMDYYLKKTTDMIMSQRLPSFSGFGSIMANIFIFKRFVRQIGGGLFTIFLVVQMVVIFVDVVQCPLFLACRQFFPFATGPADVYLGMLGDVMKLFPEDAEVLSHPSHRRCLLLPRGCFRTILSVTFFLHHSILPQPRLAGQAR